MKISINLLDTKLILIEKNNSLLFSRINELFGLNYSFGSKMYLQLSISMWQSCRSIGKYCKFIGHDAVIVNLQSEENEKL